MSTTKVATSPGTKNVFSAIGGPTGRRFRSCSMSGGAPATAASNFRTHSAEQQQYHRRHSTIHGPAKVALLNQAPAQQQQHHYHRQRNGGGGGGGGGGGAGGNCGAGTKRRAGSFSAGGNCGQYKRRKKEPGIVPPTKFLLGGNINDPLNLNSFEDEEANRAINQVTPYSSPLPTPAHRHHRVAVLIPPNINDPLNLNGGEGDIELNLVSPNYFNKKKNKRKNKRRKHASSSDTVAAPGGDANDGATDPVATDATAKTTASDATSSAATTVTTAAADPINKSVEQSGEGCGMAAAVTKTKTPEVRPSSLAVPSGTLSAHHQPRPKKLDDKIVSPVIPQPGMTRKHRPSGHHGRTAASRDGGAEANDKRRSQQSGGRRRKSGESVTTAAASSSDPVAPTNARSIHQHERFRYGNYDRYYGYRNPGHIEDYRLSCMRRDWLEGREVLDLGCNIGHVTLSVARDFRPRRIVGLDIDGRLIGIGRKNVTHYVTAESNFPISMAICYGPITTAAHLANKRDPNAVFPNNVTFIQGNYVFESDDQLDSVVPEYDTILCLSLTKWIHLNWGDDGLKRFFKRIFKNLRPGGRMILEPQNWRSYSKKKKLSAQIYENYLQILLKPENFTEYLLSKEVGFSTCEVIDIPFNHSKGFQRPMQLFTKSETSPSSTPSETLRASRQNSPGKGTTPPNV